MAPRVVRMQFERFGYFVSDRHEHRARAAVFNHVVTLRDTKLREESVFVSAEVVRGGRIPYTTAGAAGGPATTIPTA
ncbi:hypothetical protein IPC483_34635 [Pseudomonas aeruginosa]|nr:hypothetical protein IPC483_34635 [Pseudomonas aeruginosa]